MPHINLMQPMPLPPVFWAIAACGAFFLPLRLYFRIFYLSRLKTMEHV